MKTFEEIIEAVNGYLEMKAIMNEAETELDKYKEILKAALQERGIEELEVESHVVRNTTVVSNNFSGKEFKKDFPDIYEEYRRKSISKRFTVS